MTRFDLSGAIVPVTGGASGIGLAICRNLRAEGALPVLIDSDAEAVGRAIDTLYPDKTKGPYGHVVDVSDMGAVDAAFSAILSDLGPVTHAVTCAARVWRGKTMDMPEKSWQSVMNVNINGTLHACRAAARQMARNGGGAIVNVASIGGLRVQLDRTAYATTKAAVIQMTRALALELGPDGIRLNCIAPGLVRTPMQEASASFLGSTAALDAVVDRAAIKRLADPEEIARPTLFLLSDMASYITGETLVVDGGVNIRYA